MFANTLISKDYETFLGWLGDEITLEGWTRFRGGLDVASRMNHLTCIIRELHLTSFFPRKFDWITLYFYYLQKL